MIRILTTRVRWQMVDWTIKRRLVAVGFLSLSGIMFLNARGQCAPENERQIGTVMNNDERTSSIDKEVADQLRIFDETKDPSALMKSSQLIEVLEPGKELDEKQRTQIRAKKLSLWLSLLNRIDRERDPAFDADDVASRSVAVPKVKGIRLRSGMDPKDIKDPNVRRQYEEALAKNTEKAKKYALQTHLLKLDERLTQRVGVYIAEAYSNAPEDTEELKSSLETHLENERRIASYLAIRRQAPTAPD